MAGNNNSSRVVQGEGFWYSPKVSYSKETLGLLDVLMKEARLSNYQQQKLADNIRGGNPLPGRFNHNPPKSSPQEPKRSASDRQLNGRMRTRDQIEESGLYKREKFRSTCCLIKPPEEKERLQNIMAFGRDFNGSYFGTKDDRKPNAAIDQSCAVETYSNLINGRLAKKLQDLELLNQKICEAKSQVENRFNLD